MIKAKHSKFWVKFSDRYSKLLLNIFFRNIRYIGDYEPTDLPILIISNHFSWWDGFIQIQLNNKYLKRRFFFMMLEKELRKSQILTNIGAFSIAKGNRSSIESLKYCTEILGDGDNVLLLFPQGKIQSIYTREFKFEEGALMYIFKKVKNDIQILFNVNLIDYSSKRRPEISVYFKSYNFDRNISFDTIETDFNKYAGECFIKQVGE